MSDQPQSGSGKSNVTLISVGLSVQAIGLRTISAYLKNHGHQVTMVFFNLPVPLSGHLDADGLLDSLADVCRGSDLVGMSLMSGNLMMAQELTVGLKSRLKIPIVWGGVHPTTAPESCLDYADMVCVGESEDAMLELAGKIKSGDVSGIANVWSKADGKVTRNKPRPLENDLDKFPFPDYGGQGHYVIDDGRLVPMTDTILQELLSDGGGMRERLPEYIVLTARNCPHSCTYCCNNSLRKVYGTPSNFVRKRSVDNVIEELHRIRSRLPFIRSILVTDETLFYRSLEEIRDFASKYRERVGLPFACLSSPGEVDEEKLKLLSDAGLRYIAIGIQSFDQDILRRVFCRHTSPEAILRTVKLMERFSGRVTPQYQFIADNPWESRRSSRVTERFIASLPAEASVIIFPLILFPGTELHRRAISEGKLRDSARQIYSKDMSYWGMERRTYYNRMMFFHQYLRMRNRSSRSIGIVLAMKFRRTPLFHLFFLFHEAMSSKPVRLAAKLLRKATDAFSE